MRSFEWLYRRFIRFADTEYVSRLSGFFLGFDQFSSGRASSRNLRLEFGLSRVGFALVPLDRRDRAAGWWLSHLVSRGGSSGTGQRRSG